MTPDRVRQLRQRAGLTLDGLAAALRMGHDGRRRVRAWEAGKTPITGPASVALEAFASGWRSDEMEGRPPACSACDDLGALPMCRVCGAQNVTRSLPAAPAAKACPRCEGEGDVPACPECGVVYELPF